MRLAIAIATTLLLPFAAYGQEETGHAKYLASIATYKPVQGFNHIVGARRFVGYFIKDNGCAVTVFASVADDDRLRVPAIRQKIHLRAGAVAEVKADHEQALGIGCTADADEIKVTALKPRTVNTASR